MTPVRFPLLLLFHKPTNLESSFPGARHCKNFACVEELGHNNNDHDTKCFSNALSAQDHSKYFTAYCYLITVAL